MKQEAELNASFAAFLWTCLTLFLLYCESGAQIIFGAAMLALNLFGLMPLVLTKSALDGASIATGLLFLLSYFVVALGYAMLIKYIKHYERKYLSLQLKSARQETKKLLGHLDQGLVVVDARDNKALLFCNRKARSQLQSPSTSITVAEE